jgi:NAD(P) transhydrogenase subunit alpha
MSNDLQVTINIGVLQETLAGERRVSLVPGDVRRLSKRAKILIQRGAGIEAGFADDAYVDAGAVLGNRDEILRTSHVLLKVRKPDQDTTLRPGTILVSLGGRDDQLGESLKRQSVLHLGLERVPRTSRAQAMDVLSSQAAVAGYAAVIEGAQRLDTFLPMMTTAAGVFKPASMIALGAGVAGLQAIATARRLGAVVYGFDVREAAREQVESLGAKFVFPDVPVAPSEGTGGYAAEQSDNQQARLRRALDEPLSQMHLIVTSAQIPGRPAPILLDEQTVTRLRPGSVIIDLAAETGGNCSLTRPDELVVASGVRIVGPTNIASTTATVASSMFSANLRHLLEHLIDSQGQLKLDDNDLITQTLIGDQSVKATLALSA